MHESEKWKWSRSVVSDPQWPYGLQPSRYIMLNDRLDKAQAGIKTVGRNINNFRYADDSNLMAESEEKLKSLLMKVKEESEKLV